MKVKGHEESVPAKPAADKERFQRALQETGKARGPAPRPAPTHRGPGKAAPPPQPPGLVRKQPVSVQPLTVARSPATVAYATSEHLGQVRQHLHAEAHRLRDTRSESLEVGQERATQRVTELIARELSLERREAPAPRARPASLAPEGAGSHAPQEVAPVTGELRAGALAASATRPAQASEPPPRVQATLELVEKIEVMLKAQRPALSMKLGGGLDATVEVERTGSREVALRILGHRGPPSSEDLARIREALAAKGLRLSTLHAS